MRLASPGKRHIMTPRLKVYFKLMFEQASKQNKKPLVGCSPNKGKLKAGIKKGSS